MNAKDYINNMTLGGFDQAEYVTKEDALKAVDIARAEGWNDAVSNIRDAVHRFCNVRQVIEFLDHLKK